MCRAALPLRWGGARSTRGLHQSLPALPAPLCPGLSTCLSALAPSLWAAAAPPTPLTAQTQYTYPEFQEWAAEVGFARTELLPLTASVSACVAYK